MSEQPDLSEDQLQQASARAITDMFGPQVDLDQELERYHYESENGWDVIKHPLVFSIMHNPVQNGLVNKQLAYKKGACRTALAEGNWHTYVFLHERPFRVDAFKRIAKRMSDENYWDLLSEIWIDSENIRENPTVWQGLLRSRRPGREHMMSEADRALLAQFPETIEVFQGHTDERDDGWSWTIDRSKAEWFARRFADFEHADPVLSFGVAHKSDVIAFLTNRGESEILIPRSKVTICGVTKVRRNQTEANGGGAMIKHQSVADAFQYINGTTSNTGFVQIDLTEHT